MAVEHKISVTLLTFVCTVMSGWIAADASPVEEISLHGTWQLINANKSISVKGSVPGSVHTALIASNIIEDPYYRFNDVDYRWIANDNWTYTTDFTVSKEVLSKDRVVLVCHGLDTVANVSINGVLVGNSSNMFIRYEYNIKKQLKEGNNSISIAFQSAPSYAKHQSSVYNYTVPPECPPPVQHGVCHPNFIRKEQCSFSWDWGPAFAPQGIWKNISIQAYDTSVIRDVMVHTIMAKGGSSWSINVTVFFAHVPDEQQITSKLSISMPELSLKKDVNVTLSSNSSHTSVFVSKILSVKEWWPSGYGDQKLYSLKVTFGETSSKTLKIGFRHVKLVQEPIKDSSGLYQGLSFYFAINGQPIFLKGSNWIPADAFQERISEDRLRNLLQSTVDANMHALRVWGGGVYEQDVFYDICDELGILIWQDFMFGCAMYPTNQEFLTSVQLEVAQQIQRLSSHPSILIWAGNNENEAALQQNCFLHPASSHIKTLISQIEKECHDSDLTVSKNKSITGTREMTCLTHLFAGTYFYYIFVHYDHNHNVAKLQKYGTNSSYKLYKDDYIKLYIDVIREQVLLHDPQEVIPYVSSSPSNGVETEKEGWVAWQPQDTHYGDVHYYNYGADCWSVGTFPTPRFASEYGYQSWPSFETVSLVSEKSDWSYTSDFSEHRQHHSLGNPEMTTLIQKHFDLPSKPDAIDIYKDTLYLTQISQAMCIKVETEHYRRLQSTLVNGEGHTMGALYWQLNDIWQAPTWASIEYGGKWKILHYYAKNFFAPILASGMVEDKQLYVYVITDVQDLQECSLKINVHKWDTLDKPAHTVTTQQFKQSRQSSVMQYKANVDDLLKLSGCSSVKKDCFLTFQVLSSSSQVLSPVNPLFVYSFNEAGGLSKPNIQVKVGQTSANVFTIRLTTDHVAPFTWLETPGIRGRFSDNGFVMLERVVFVEFYSWQPTTNADVEKAITVTSLMNIYA